MNKDMDERVLPPGQYRDALNIQISTYFENRNPTPSNFYSITKTQIFS